MNDKIKSATLELLGALALLAWAIFSPALLGVILALGLSYLHLMSFSLVNGVVLGYCVALVKSHWW